MVRPLPKEHCNERLCMIRFHSFHTTISTTKEIYGLSVDPRFLQSWACIVLGHSRQKSILIYHHAILRTVLLPDIFHPIGRKSSTVFRRRNTFLKYRSQTMTTTMFEIFDFSFLFEFFPVFHRNSIVKSNV